jgi:UDP-N-acetyl-D-glucosamine/UDP-N-acetyl-D-galactosamine dehydrogenase
MVKGKGTSVPSVGIVGLGYVGLPLALAFGKRFRTIGFDTNSEKVLAYGNGIDPTGEAQSNDFEAASSLQFTTDPASLRSVDFAIIAVPTPVDSSHSPNFDALIAASRTVGRNLKHGAIVVYESTVYPGATEEICIPILELESGKRWREDFFVGYSPERINPGDKNHRLENIVKVVAGDSQETLDNVARLYEVVVAAGVYRASSIKVAEAAKVIENTQRDLNIALVNELALIFHKVGIDTNEVLAAAGTKWNFLPFRPGLVGGHCIGVDPYYLTYKAEQVGYHPQVILAGRRINDGMGKYIAEQTIKCIIRRGLPVHGADITVLGLTFKEDVPDLRNSKVIDVVRELQSYGAKVHLHDPVANPDEAMHEYGVELKPWSSLPRSSALVAAVAHKAFEPLSSEDIASKLVVNGIVVDVKARLDKISLERKGFEVWRL